MEPLRQAPADGDETQADPGRPEGPESDRERVAQAEPLSLFV